MGALLFWFKGCNIQVNFRKYAVIGMSLRSTYNGCIFAS